MERPSIVVILTDDQGWGDLSLNGNANLATPHIDRMAREGAVFDWFYVQPVCAPTRAELLTGRWYPRTGVRGVQRRAEMLNLDETTLGDVFKRAGYATGCFGKWHSGSAYPYHPNGRGFDEFYGYCCGHWSHYFDSTLERNGQEVKAEGYLTDALTTEALRFIETHQAEPFLCYVPLNTPHSPFQVPDKWHRKFDDADLSLRCRPGEEEDLAATRCVLGMCENIDWNVGRLVDKVAELGLSDQTIFVYFSDNGPNTWRWNGGMRGKKGSTDEGGVRSPCVVRWPGRVPAGRRIAQIAGAIDVLPTLADLAGIDLAVEKPIDGVSLKPLLTGDAADWPDRPLFAHWSARQPVSVRTQEFRAGGPAAGLYRMAEDPCQECDLSQELPEVHAALMARIDAWRADALPPTEPDERPLPAGYPEFPHVYLNAQDGIPSGEITWSAIHPNASYFINWTRAEDEMRWDVDVRTAGKYRVTVYYTCPEGDEGSVIEAAFGNASVSARVEPAFDPPLRDDADRVPRVESYEKPFRPLELGVLDLPAERGDVVLRARSVAGGLVCDVRALRLELLL